MKCELSEVGPKAILHIFSEFCWCLGWKAQPSSHVLLCQQNWLGKLTPVHLICKFLFSHILLCHSVVTVTQGPGAQGLEQRVSKWAHIVVLHCRERHLHMYNSMCTKIFKAAWRTLQTQLKLWHEENNYITVIYDFAILEKGTIQNPSFLQPSHGISNTTVIIYTMKLSCQKVKWFP